MLNMRIVLRRPTLAALASRLLLPGAGASQVTLAGTRHAWPPKPVKIGVPYPAGGGADVLARCGKFIRDVGIKTD